MDTIDLWPNRERASKYGLSDATKTFTPASITLKIIVSS
jgi:hypothetical protein